MHKRTLTKPDTAFFLFGPRSVGKSTWLKQQFPNALYIDLLPHETMLKYLKNPSYLIQRVSAEDPARWVIIDEVQKIPELLDVVHSLIENHGHKNIILCGSSARKLRHGAANLLAGRLISRHLAPFTSAELGFNIRPEQILDYGLLPLSTEAPADENREDFLRAYNATYIAQEIKAEGLVRNIGSFARFMEVAALCAGTQVNVTAIARDSGIARDTVQGYFEVFEDTLLGSWLPAYRPRAKVKERTRPKFYWFDCGVLNAAAGAFDQPMARDWRGVLLEHWVHHELTTYLQYTKLRGSLGFWKTASGTEVDFIWWYGDKAIAIEVKSGQTFRRGWLKGIKALSQSMPLHASYIVYLGTEPLKEGETKILPATHFLKLLHSNKILPKL